MGILKIPEWIIKFTYVNLLWYCFTVVGLFFFGFFPATMALFAIIRKWIMGETDIPTFRTFWHYYKKDFVKSNVVGFMLTISSAMLYLDYVLLEQARGLIFNSLFALLLPIIFMFIFTICYSFSVFVHYNFRPVKVIHQAFLVMIVSPLSTLMMIAGMVILYFSLRGFPGLVVLFGPSLLALLVMYSSYLSFENILNRKQKDSVEVGSAQDHHS
ncbi:YesL family protein [Aquibacillus salsiterrae]|uniref:DUF624 domain-containing protein n=1 Tax=Aquibacillus salsiterrae TaxID=2950439 RepID=A0A9X3WF62_9BACI|nr:DUF624 domain-containing protein [Aquibacillus salsiterrae]MDC3415921.1 DUF624 domain-containing protein [Aquibacillus salsiterrae]